MIIGDLINQHSMIIKEGTMLGRQRLYRRSQVSKGTLNKLNRWAGTKGINYADCDLGMAYCFRYLATRLTTIVSIVKINFIVSSHTEEGACCTIANGLRGEVMSTVDEETPTIAFCLAVEKIIDAFGYGHP